MKKKTQFKPIRMDDCDGGEEIFHWWAWETNEQWVVAVSKLENWLKDTGRVPLTSIALTPELMRHIAEHGGVEKENLEAMPPWQASKPAILLAGPSGSHVVADGNHRLLKRYYMMGIIDAPAYMVPRAIWRRFRIVDAPPLTKAQHDAWVYGGSRTDSPHAYDPLTGEKK